MPKGKSGKSKGGTSQRFIDAGTTSALLDGDLASSHYPHAKPTWKLKFKLPEGARIVTKVMTDKSLFEKEIETARILSNVDPEQMYCLYPFAAYEVPADKDVIIGAKAFKHLEKQKLSIDAQEMYLLIMQYGGESIDKMKANGIRLTDEQAKRIIADLMYGLSSIHNLGHVHRDVHIHNAVMTYNPPRAYWIDFGMLHKSSQKANDVALDADGLVSIIRTVLSMTDPDRLRDFKAAIRNFKATDVAKIFNLSGYNTLTSRAPLQMFPSTFQTASKTPSPTNTSSSSLRKTEVQRTPLLSLKSVTRTPSPTHKSTSNITKTLNFLSPMQLSDSNSGRTKRKKRKQDN